MTTNAPTQADFSSPQNVVGTERWKQRSIAFLRILFGLIWLFDAWWKWVPEFQNDFVSQVSGAQSGQSGIIQVWITLWTNIVSVNPLLFARVEAVLETLLAVFLILGVFSNFTNWLGILLSLVIWTVAEGFGGPFIAGQTTDIGAGLPCAVIFALLLVLDAGRYYGLDQWLTSRLGRFGFLASGSIKRSNK